MQEIEEGGVCRLGLVTRLRRVSDGRSDRENKSLRIDWLLFSRSLLPSPAARGGRQTQPYMALHGLQGEIFSVDLRASV
jgi:hypothetical protein